VVEVFRLPIVTTSDRTTGKLANSIKPDPIITLHLIPKKTNSAEHKKSIPFKKKLQLIIGILATALQAQLSTEPKKNK
jgi:hypothetical protein